MHGKGDIAHRDIVPDMFFDYFVACDPDQRKITPHRCLVCECLEGLSQLMSLVEVVYLD